MVCKEEVELFESVGLDEEGKGQKGIMKEVGRRYGELLQTIEDVKGEIDRLKGGEESGGTTRKVYDGKRNAKG